MKAHLKARAASLRRCGYSFAEISACLGVSKSTASLWTRSETMLPDGRRRLAELQERSHMHSGMLSHERKLKRLEEAYGAARSLLFAESREPAVVLSMLYLCEGEKRDGKMCFTNSDEGTMRLFMAALRRTFQIDESKLRVLVHIHGYHNDLKVKEHWSDVTSVPISQFYRSFIKKSEHRYKKEGYMGCAHVYYHDASVARTLKQFAKELANSYI